MGVATWHPGKISLLWAGCLFLLAVLWLGKPPMCRTETLWLWAALAAPSAVVTWGWFGARGSKSTGGQHGRWLRVVAWLAWAVAVVVLFLAYFECGSVPGFR